MPIRFWESLLENSFYSQGNIYRKFEELQIIGAFIVGAAFFKWHCLAIKSNE